MAPTLPPPQLKIFKALEKLDDIILRSVDFVHPFYYFKRNLTARIYCYRIIRFPF